MKNKLSVRLAIRRAFYRFGGIVAGVLISCVLCVCVFSMMQKEYMECLNAGVMTDKCVYFTVKLSDKFDFWSVADKNTVRSVSYMTADIDDACPEYVRYISYGERVYLPVGSDAPGMTAAQWNASDEVFFAGSKLFTEEKEGETVYISYDPVYREYKISGRLGCVKTSLTDLFLYASFDGVLEAGKREYIAEGDDIQRLTDSLRKLGTYISQHDIGTLEITQTGLSGEKSVSTGVIMLPVLAACAAVYLYLIYFWISMSRKELLVLTLLGVPRSEILWRKWLPMPVCMAAVFALFALSFGVMYPGLIGLYAAYLRLGALYLLGASLLYGVVLIAFIFGLRDISGELK